MEEKSDSTVNFSEVLSTSEKFAKNKRTKNLEKIIEVFSILGIFSGLLAIIDGCLMMDFGRFLGGSWFFLWGILNIIYLSRN